MEQPPAPTKLLIAFASYRDRPKHPNIFFYEHDGVAKGKIVGQELTRWPDQLDFSAELSKAREARPDAIFAFYPGGAGIQFVTQYAQSGLK